MRSALPVAAAIALSLVLAGCDTNTPTATTAPAEPAAPAAEPEPAAAAQPELDPLFGAWAIDAANCATPIRIAEASFEGHENACTITGWSADGADTHTATMTCTGEGQTATERVAMTAIFGPQGEGIRLNYLDRGGDPVTVFRCPAGGAQ